MRRTRCREVALQTLYQRDLNPGLPARQVNTFVRRRMKNTPLLLDYTKALIEGVESHKPELDAHIQAVAENWRLDRMAALDRNILRIGLYEIQKGGKDTPPNVAVNEALELAKQIGFPAWVDVAVDKAEGVFKKSPDRDEFAADVNESLIVELYSR